MKEQIRKRIITYGGILGALFLLYAGREGTLSIHELYERGRFKKIKLELAQQQPSVFYISGVRYTVHDGNVTDSSGKDKDPKGTPLSEKLKAYVIDHEKYPKNPYVTKVQTDRQLDEIMKESKEKGIVVFQLWVDNSCTPCYPAYLDFFDVARRYSGNSKVRFLAINDTVDENGTHLVYKHVDENGNLTDEPPKIPSPAAAPVLRVIYPGKGEPPFDMGDYSSAPRWFQFFQDPLGDINTPFRETLEGLIEKIK